MEDYVVDDDLVAAAKDLEPPDPDAKIIDPLPDIAGGGDFAG